jgi:mRNA-degrading endonuclease RelE of RelBE toxin-antitoxin system
VPIEPNLTACYRVVYAIRDDVLLVLVVRIGRRTAIYQGL